MKRLLTFHKRRADLSHDQFLDQWTNVYGPLVAKLAGDGQYLKKYIQHQLNFDPILESKKSWVPTDIADYPFDGISEFWFESYESRDAFFAQPAVREAIVAEEARFIDMTTPRLMFENKPVVVYDLPRDDWSDPVKLLGFYRRRSDISREYYRERTYAHGIIVADTPGSGIIIRNNTQNHMFLDPLADTPEKYWAPIWKPDVPEFYPFDSFSQAWFRDVAARDTFIAEPHLQEKVIDDERGFIDMDVTRLMFIDSEVVAYDGIGEWPEPVSQSVKF